MSDLSFRIVACGGCGRQIEPVGLREPEVGFCEEYPECKGDDMKIIGKTLDQIIELDPELDDLTDWQLCYILGLGMGDRSEYDGRPTSQKPPKNASYSKEWPDYISSSEHCFRVLEALPDAKYVDTHIRYNKWTVSCNQGPSNEGPEIYAQKYDDIKEAITKAAAKCVLNGIELEVE